MHCVKAKQILESQLFPWLISDDHCYNLRFTAKQRGVEKKNKTKKPRTGPRERSCKSWKTTERKQREGRETEGKNPGMRAEGNNPRMKAEGKKTRNGGRRK